MLRKLTFLCVLLMGLSSAAQAISNKPLYDAMRKCAPSTHTFKIGMFPADQWTIKGMQNGRCVFDVNKAGSILQKCQLPQEKLNKIADTYEFSYETGNFSMGTNVKDGTEVFNDSAFCQFGGGDAVPQEFIDNPEAEAVFVPANDVTITVEPESTGKVIVREPEKSIQKKPAPKKVNKAVGGGYFKSHPMQRQQSAPSTTERRKYVPY